MANRTRIETPRGKLIQIHFKNGSVSCRLTWNPGFGSQRTAKFQSVQSYVDSEVLRYCGPYVPFRTGMLMRSGELGTAIGSGKVSYIAPYARRLYYGTHFNFDRTGHPNAGPLWLERMKIDHRKDLLRGVAAIVGGKAHGG